MAVPEKGALVTVQFMGEVHDVEDHRGGFWLKVPYDALLRTPETSSWVPPTATVRVVRAARPREVLLLECGHVTDQKTAEDALGYVCCWRYPCHGQQGIAAVGSVTW